MAQSGVSVASECIEKFNELKLGKSLKWIIFKITDDWKQIVVEDTSKEDNWEEFREKLISAKSKPNARSGEVIGCRYAVYDIEYQLKSGDGIRNKITFISWAPDDSGVKVKMLYASSKDALKRSLNGLASNVEANDNDDIEYDSVIKSVSGGLA